ncbi:MAG: MFS transporter [Planctomycetes bacterium]|nr:MFS transporter [Planctomycetota bacterium]
MSEPEGTTSTQTHRPGALAPLARPVFRWLWIAALASNIGTWANEVGVGWEMTTLTKEMSAGRASMLVALIQVAASLPSFLLAMPAGALADVLDRRRMMIFWQVFALGGAAFLAITTFAGIASPVTLIMGTALLGIGAAMTNPAYQTAMADLVPREELPSASALNSVSLNLSRATGPALGGLVVAAVGAWAVFALNALSFVGFIVVLWWWRMQPRASSAPTERFLGALKAGVRYVRYSHPAHAVLVRTASYVLPASALWALMPLLARNELGMTAKGYGVLLGALGAGAVTGAAVLPRIRRVINEGRIKLVAVLIYALAMAMLGALATLVDSAATWRVPAAIGVMFFAGCCWLTMVTLVNVAAQTSSPGWVRARVFACYLTVHFGALTAGSLVWGQVAALWNVPIALWVAAGAMALGAATMTRWPLPQVRADDFGRSDHWLPPSVSGQIDPEAGPVVITVEYRVIPARAAEFRQAMDAVAQTRYRDGAVTWLLTQDTEDQHKWLEVFICETWGEHLRQHDRVTVADREIQQFAHSFHTGSERPKVGHFVAPLAPGAAATALESAPSSAVNRQTV